MIVLATDRGTLTGDTIADMVEKQWPGQNARFDPSHATEHTFGEIVAPHPDWPEALRVLATVYNITGRETDQLTPLLEEASRCQEHVLEANRLRSDLIAQRNKALCEAFAAGAGVGLLSRATSLSRAAVDAVVHKRA